MCSVGEERGNYMAEKWMQKESEREEKAGTKGSFSRAAKRAGYSTQEYARKEEHAKGKLGRRARMALRYSAARKGR